MSARIPTHEAARLMALRRLRHLNAALGKGATFWAHPHAP
jgi:hypothetical protein